MLVRRCFKIRHYGAGVLPATFATRAAAEAHAPAVAKALDPAFAHHTGPGGAAIEPWTRVVPDLHFLPDDMFDVAMRYEQLSPEEEAAALQLLAFGFDAGAAARSAPSPAGELVAKPAFAGEGRSGT